MNATVPAQGNPALEELAPLMPKSGDGLTPITVAFGDGIGPEIMKASLKVLLSAGARIAI